MTETQPRLYAGLSHVTYSGRPFELGDGIVLRSTCAHLFATNLTFGRATEGKSHPAPWRAARGEFGYDVEIELAVPTGQKLPRGLSGEDTSWNLWNTSILNRWRGPWA